MDKTPHTQELALKLIIDEKENTSIKNYDNSTNYG